MTYDDFLPDTLPLLPGIGMPRVERALLRAAQELCRTARIWRIWSDEVSVQKAGEYDYDLPSGAQIEVVEALTVNGAYRTPTPWTLAPGAPEDVPLHRIVAGKLAYTLPKALGAAVKVRWRLSLSPAEGCSNFPDEIFAPWAALLAEGIVGRCQADVGRPWSSGDAAAHLKAFADGCDAARKRTWHGYTDVTPRQQVVWC